MIIMVIITSIKSQGYLAKHECSANCGDYKLTEIRTNEMKSNHIKKDLCIDVVIVSPLSE